MKTKYVYCIALCFLLSACTDNDEKPKEPINSSEELITENTLEDEKLTIELNEKLMATTKGLELSLEAQSDIANKKELKDLNEEDRQALIDLTIQESAKIIENDAIEVVNEKEEAASLEP